MTSVYYTTTIPKVEDTQGRAGFISIHRSSCRVEAVQVKLPDTGTNWSEYCSVAKAKVSSRVCTNSRVS